MRFLRTESRPQQPRPLKLAQRRDRIRGLELVGMCYADPTTHRPPQTDKKLGRSMRRHLDSQPLPSLKASIPSHTACALYHGACGQSSDACTAPPQRSQAAAEDIILPSTESQSPRVCSTGPVASSRSWRHHPARAFHGRSPIRTSGAAQVSTQVPFAIILRNLAGRPDEHRGPRSLHTADLAVSVQQILGPGCMPHALHA